MKPRIILWKKKRNNISSNRRKQKTISNEKNEKINKRVSLIQTHENRRKSILINQINKKHETKMKRREKILFHY